MTETPKRPRDPNQLAKLVVDIATCAAEDGSDLDKGPMAILGRAGGLRGGRARAQKLTREHRLEIARRAATVRWGKDDN